MNPKVKATIWYVLTAVFAVFGIVWTWTGAPSVWPTIVAIVGTVASAVLGITFTPPAPPSA
jgi:hypothetical protein